MVNIFSTLTKKKLSRIQFLHVIIFFVVDVTNKKKQMEEIIVKWRAYKEEYEKLSDWLQGIENAIKSHKTTLFSNVPEKENQFVQVQVRLVKENICN